MESIVLYKQYDEGIVHYTGDMMDYEEIQLFVLDNYLPLIKSEKNAALSQMMYQNATMFVLFIDPDDETAYDEINTLGKELNAIFD